jgi:hypothetical protein
MKISRPLEKKFEEYILFDVLYIYELYQILNNEIKDNNLDIKLLFSICNFYINDEIQEISCTNILTPNEKNFKLGLSTFLSNKFEIDLNYIIKNKEIKIIYKRRSFLILDKYLYELFFQKVDFKEVNKMIKDNNENND